MRWKETVRLVSKTYGQDEYLQPTETETAREVYANEWTVSERLRTASGVAELQDFAALEILTCEDGGETAFDWAGLRYTVVDRKRKGDRTVLTGRRLISDG